MDTVALTLLTGFLGSGKTTLLNAVLRHAEFADSAVLINEFGSIGLDHLLVEEVSDGIVLLGSGCVCCEVADDLAAALTRLVDARATGAVPPFARIILETTGVADPGAVLQALLVRPVNGAALTLDRVITVIDAVLGQASLNAFPECAAQILMADVLVLSKAALALDRGARLAERVALLAPGVPLVSHEDAVADPARLFTAAPAVRAVPARMAHGHAGRYATFTIGWDQPVAFDRFAAWLDGLLGARGEDILRLKGLLRVEGEDAPVVIQGVQHMIFAPTRLAAWPGAPATRLVIIARHFTPTAAHRSLAPFLPELA